MAPQGAKLPNNRVNLTAQQVRCWVPSALRAPAAVYGERWAAFRHCQSVLQLDADRR
jgi:hypothetical protein